MSLVGLVGLGAMGAGMAGSLRRAGHTVHVYDVRPEAAQAFAAQGGVACATLAELGAACDVVISVVVNADQTEQVLWGADGQGGVARAMKPGSTFVMCSTVAPGASRAIAMAGKSQTRSLVQTSVPCACSQSRAPIRRALSQESGAMNT